MKIAILQSGYLPWLGFFDLMARADVFVYLDDVQWTTRDWRSRNRIRIPLGWTWLSVPVKLERPHFEYKICEVNIDYSQDWPQRHLRAIQSAYSRARYFADIFSRIERHLTRRYIYINELNYALIQDFRAYMGIHTTIKYAQDLNISSDKTKSDRLLAIVQAVPGAKAYLAGNLSKDYLNLAQFEKQGIQVEWQEYQHPFYLQNTWRSSTFISYLSVVDLLFHHGPESLDIILGKKQVPKHDGINVCTADNFKKSS